MSALAKKASIVVFFLIITLATIYYGNDVPPAGNNSNSKVVVEVFKKRSLKESAAGKNKHELTKDVLEQNLLWMQNVTDPQYDLEEVRKTQVERISLVNKFCLNHTSPGLGKRAGSLYFLTFRDVSWGLLPKTGSTNILRMVCIIIGPKCTKITGYPDEHHYVPGFMEQITDLDSYSSGYSNWPTRKFLYAFVRDPWQRLVSTYIEKVLFSDSYIVICRYGRNAKFLELHRKLKQEHTTLTYSQFLKYCVIEQYENGGAIAMEPHYRPQSISGAFCDLGYSFIGKTETYGEDIKVVLQQYNVKDVPALIAEAKQFRKPNEKKNITLSSYLDRWKSVDQETIMKLQKIYSVDIEMFGYPRQPY